MTLIDKITEYCKKEKTIKDVALWTACAAGCLIMDYGAIKASKAISEYRYRKEVQTLEQQSKEYWQERGPNADGSEPTLEEIQDMIQETKRIKEETRTEIFKLTHPEIFQKEQIKQKPQIKQNREPKYEEQNPQLNSAFVYAPIIKRVVEKYNNKFNFRSPLREERIYAMIMTEAQKGEAFRKDPMQIANKGDHALKALAKGEEYTWQIGNFSHFKKVEPTKIKHWRRTYDSDLTPEISIEGGVAWLINKAAIRDDNGEIIGWRDWDSATNRYNGGGDSRYVHKVAKKEQQIRYLRTIAKN